MIVDSSVAAAICLAEPDAADFVDVIELASTLRMSAGTYLEAAVVIEGREPGAFDAFVRGLGIEIVPFDQAQADLARTAYRKFGRGSGHPAALNFGDCFAYALARTVDEPLLFKGNDFTLTDVRPAIPT